MAQRNDRWVPKILSLPIFDEAFTKAVESTPLSSLAFVLAMDVGSSVEFVDLALRWAHSWDVSVLTVFSEKVHMLEQYWSICKVSEKAFLESTAFQLGFGMCESREAPVSCSKEPRSQSALVALTAARNQAPKRSSSGAEKSASSTPLLDKEHAEKLKWAARLENIGKRAGSHARLFTEQDQSENLSPGEMSRLRQLVLICGAHRTMAVHVKAFERFENWADQAKVPMYPLEVDKVLKYALSLDEQECGPSVIPALKISIKWVASRLVMDLPDLEDMRLGALQQKVIAARAKTLKEAVAIPLGVVGAMELIVVNDACPTAMRVFVWWLLCMVYASLRFDDAIHVKPSELIMMEEGIFGVAWQTKVDRKRAGTRFMVPKVGFQNSAWLEVGWDLMKYALPGDRDFWVPELNTIDVFKEHAPTYTRTVQWLRYFARSASDRRKDIEPKLLHTDAVTIGKLTAHSCRVTLLDAAVHAGRSSEEIGLQANWKNPGPLVLKYTRNRTQVPALMIKQLVQDLVANDHPTQPDKDTLLTDVSDQDLCAAEFFIKSPTTGRGYEYRFHATALGDSSVLACGKFKIDECQSAGNFLPDPAVLCKACAKQRPDLVP